MNPRPWRARCGGAPASAGRGPLAQSACLRRNAGISNSSMPLLASASTFAAALRPCARRSA